MKIAHLIFSLNTGGAESMLVEILNHQVKNDFISLIIINKEYNVNIINKIDRNVSVLFIDRIPNSRNLIPIIKLNWQLLKLSPDVIHCHDVKAINTLLPNFQRKAVLTLHTTGIKHRNLNKFSQLFAISETVANEIAPRGKNMPKVIYNGIALDLIKVRSKNGFLKKFKIVQVGRLCHQIKGQDILLNALEIVIKKFGYQFVHLDLIGEGDSYLYLKKLSEDLAISSFVNFTGLKDRNFIYNNLCKYNLLIQPSIFEGFGLTIAEAMAAKVPVLVSDIDGPMEIIGKGEYGYSFKSEDIMDLANNIKFIIDNYHSEQLSFKIIKAYNYANEKFSIKTTADCYLKQYVKI